MTLRLFGISRDLHGSPCSWGFTRHKALQYRIREELLEEVGSELRLS
jgi:hypothetical protein